MRAAANRTVSIIRAVTTDAWGDAVDTETVLYTRVLCSLIEQNRRVYLPAEQAFRYIRSYAGRVGPETDLQKNDRIKDERTNIVYLVTDLGDPESAALQPDITFTASRTT